MKKNRAPGTVWMMRYPGTYPNGYVVTREDDLIRVGFLSAEDGWQENITLSRKDARLLAKRINQCLDSTVKS